MGRELRRVPEGWEQRLVDDWNAKYPVGTPVTYYYAKDPLIEPRHSRTRSEAQLLAGHTAVVWLEGVAGCWALDCVRAGAQA
jgi:hypothetical protein